MRLEVFKNFITPEQCQQLNAWVYEAVENSWLGPGISKMDRNYQLRLTSRLYADRFEYPDLVRELSDRIRDFVGIADCPLITGHGRDGVVVSYTLPGGDVYRHRDPRSSNDWSALRCNILTQAADTGGVLFVDDQQIDIEVGDLHCYLASDYFHSVTEVQGNTPRIMWMFGAYAPASMWEKQ
jgi:hypothetical protein